MLFQNRCFWAFALAFLLWTAPLGMMAPAFAQVEDERYNPICEAGQNCGRSGGSIAMMGILGVVLTFIIHKNWLAYRANRTELVNTHGDSETDGIASGGGSTVVQGEPDEVGGTTINITQDEEQQDCMETCIVKRYENKRGFRIRNIRIVTFDESGEKQGEGVRLSADPDVAARRLDGMVAGGMISRQFADRLTNEVRTYIESSTAHKIGISRSHQSVKPCQGENCICNAIIRPADGPAVREVVTDFMNTVTFTPHPATGATQTTAIEVDYEMTVDATTHSDTCRVMSEDDY